jgi:hypothetical protein
MRVIDQEGWNEMQPNQLQTNDGPMNMRESAMMTMMMMTILTVVMMMTMVMIVQGLVTLMMMKTQSNPPLQSKVPRTNPYRNPIHLHTEVRQ